jgi:hypothetical protein
MVVKNPSTSPVLLIVDIVQSSACTGDAKGKIADITINRNASLRLFLFSILYMYIPPYLSFTVRIKHIPAGLVLIPTVMPLTIPDRKSDDRE